MIFLRTLHDGAPAQAIQSVSGAICVLFPTMYDLHSCELKKDGKQIQLTVHASAHVQEYCICTNTMHSSHGSAASKPVESASGGNDITAAE